MEVVYAEAEEKTSDHARFFSDQEVRIMPSKRLRKMLGNDLLD